MISSNASHGPEGLDIVDPSEIDALLDFSGDSQAQGVFEDTRKRAQWLTQAKQQRKKRGFSQAELGRRMGTTQSAVSDLESGRVEPRLGTMQKWARALNCQLDYEFAEENDFMAGLEENELVREHLTELTLKPLLTTLIRQTEEEARTLGALRDIVPEMFPDSWINQLLMGLTNHGWATVSGEGEAKVYSLQPTVAHVIGVSLHSNAVRAARMDMNGDIVGDVIESSLSSSGYEGTLAVVTDLVKNLCASRTTKVLGVGVALAGVVDSTQGIVHAAPHMSSESEWTHVPLAADLQERLQSSCGRSLPVVIENDANALAALEYLLGGGSSSLAVILVSGIGIGSGFIMDGRINRGQKFAAGETGHIIVEPNGADCRHGFNHRGCLETVASPGGILEALGLPAASTHQRQEGMIRANELIAAGHSKAEETFLEAGKAVGQLNAMIIGMTDPLRSIIYADKYLVDESHSTARAFRRGVAEAMEHLNNVHLSFVDHPVVTFKELRPASRAIAAGASAVWNFLRHPVSSLGSDGLSRGVGRTPPVQV